MESEPRLKPLPLSFTRQYLEIDLPRIRTSVTKLVSQSEVYFSKPLDRVRFRLSTPDGARTEDVPISDAGQVFDLVEANDTSAVTETIPPQINKWLEDYGIGEGNAI